MITERDVHREFFSAPPAVRTISFTPLPTQQSLSSGSFISRCNPRWRVQRRINALREHTRFALSLLSNYVPRISKSSVTLPGWRVLRVLGQSLWKQRAPPHDTISPRHLGPKQWENVQGHLTESDIRGCFWSDIIIGFSIGAMSIPQGMSYALLAGLAYQYGLYNNLIHPFIYFFLGSSRHAITGVSAVENLMVGESLDTLVGSKANMADRLNAAIILSLLSALIFLVFKCARLAVMADLLADPVLSGFASAAAFLVGTSQLKHAFGMSDLKSEWAVPKSWYYICTHLELITIQSLTLCVGSVIFLLACKWISHRMKGSWFVPGPLLLVVLGCTLSIILQFEAVHGIKLVGNIPGGLPGAFKFPTLTWIGDESPPDRPLLRLVFLEAVKLSSVFFVIHISIVKTIALRQRYQVDVGQELVAFSATNLVGSCFQCYPTCTSISRSSVAESLGAKTGLQGPAASAVVLCTLLFLTRFLASLPMPCLAAIVLVGVATMTEFGEFKRLWNLQKTSWKACTTGKGGSSPDLVLWLVAFLATLCLGATEGILISVVLSLVWIGKSILRPPFIELGRLPNTIIYRDRLRFPDSVEIDPHIAIFRIDAPLNFCNSAFLERQVKLVIETRFAPFCSHPMSSTSPGVCLQSPQAITTSPDSHMETALPASNGPKRANVTEMVRMTSNDPLLSPHHAHMLTSPHSQQSNSSAVNCSPTVPAYLELSTTHPIGTQTESSANMPTQSDFLTSTNAEYPGSSKTTSPDFQSGINVFILDCSSINGLDVTAIAAIERIVRNAMAYGVIVAFSNWKGPQRDFLWRANFYKVVPPQRCFFSNHDAYLWAKALRIRADGSEVSIPVSTKANSSSGMAQSGGPVGLASNPPQTGADIWHHIEARDQAGTLMSQEGVPTLTVEWDGLSALVPNVRVVHEVTADGLRDWEVSMGERPDAP